MDVLLWAVVAVAIASAVVAVVWWSSGRARPLAPHDEGLLTPGEHARLDLDTIDTSLNRRRLWGGLQ